MTTTAKHSEEYLARVLEIRGLDWRETKEIADQFAIAKPADKKWDDMAPDIAAAEFKEAGKSIYADNADTEPDSSGSSDSVEPPSSIASNLPDSIAQPETTIVEAVQAAPENTAIVAASLYPTEFYKSLGIPVCQTCGDKRRYGSQGPVCSQGRADCPQLN